MQYEYQYHIGDLPGDIVLTGSLAIDTEAMGLNNHRDRLCLIQIADELGAIHLVHFKNQNFDAPNLKKLLSDNSRQKIFHFARFDVAIIQHYLKIDIDSIFCTKISSKLCRTYNNYHSLLDLCQELLGVKISKQQQSSDWGAANLNPNQLAYAAQDVKYLHRLRDKLTTLLQREGRKEVAEACFRFLPTKAKLDNLGWMDSDIFAHH
ncbi:ribonuclease D [Candidatus Bandiella euplotis]|uniref:Ribonuclease D n=1 Tax=Candidatus Bandiella euplotis TaxID=1664265 RepID=A0ABZ0UJE6_9RICK|nr:ribonuclease H-like domain-containing protein [Candidatus Bandiella woodruffii]WPX96235.1 Ribonuclease D [Candidatus Bandiella woodruffii]